MKYAWFALLAVLAVAPVRAEDVKIATYNIEYFDAHFLADHLTTSTLGQSPEGKSALGELRKKNEEDNWETASVILDPAFDPDILVIEEGCNQADLEKFNKEWLKGAYATAIQFPGNSERSQYLCLLMKPGFKILETRDKYYLEPDPVGNERSERLFARGPAFVKVETPAGKQLWVGVTHMKSKYVPTSATTASQGAAEGEKESAEVRQRRVDATKWRIREFKRAHEIMKELEKAGPSDVILLGDMNDTLGFDDYEHDAGGDAMEILAGPVEDGLFLVTRGLSDAKENTYNGYWRDRFREVIDHALVTESLKGKVRSVRIVKEGMAPVASDHFPVLVVLKLE